MKQATYLLDTSILSELMRNPAGKAAKKIAEVGEERLCTSIIVACELRFGAAKKAAKTLTGRVEQLLAVVQVLPLAEGVDRHYAQVRARLEKKGMPIGPNDLLIAAHALALDLTLVSANTREFSRITGLKLQNWL